MQPYKLVAACLGDRRSEKQVTLGVQASEAPEAEKAAVDISFLNKILIWEITTI